MDMVCLGNGVWMDGVLFIFHTGLCHKQGQEQLPIKGSDAETCKKKTALKTVTHFMVQYCICSGSSKAHLCPTSHYL